MQAFARIFRNLRNSLVLSKSNFIGEDHFGNKYYERIADEKRQKKGYRYVKSYDGQRKVNSELEIPTEWNAWLRNSRNNPPTIEEIERNNLLMMRTRQRALEVDAVDDKEKSSLVANSEMTTNLDSSKLNEKQAHPDFEDMEIKSGIPRKFDYKDKEKPIDRTVS
ncbi:NADH dehydrogenase [ubiquinone] 1 alpha subcomplex assembly factor 2-like [Ylistrum balloti]|uniref:NADH dehydrogenase [ubiquinone] 1 alpha subcomplex assembly factor 2-like n=1 Tax=Ylistrum balloti TaxID=509963 RepID=UPI002905983D|nr:NADH dehydrogenase [ubiquinone] 1 alpha subcomplex assembly factor 2-like [Ylistrum balloti]